MDQADHNLTDGERFEEFVGLVSSLEKEVQRIRAVECERLGLRKQTLMEEPIVKRIIATEGQTVDIDFDDGVVYVDGKALDEPYVNEPVHDRENFEGKITVPEGCVFVMGDNRNASTDSRDARLGCVDTRYIMGRVYFTLFPVKNIGVVK